MDDDVAPSPDKAIRRPILVGVALGVRLTVLGVGLIVAALLAHRGPPDRPLSKVPFVSEGFAAGSVGFIMMAVAAAVIAGTHNLSRANEAGALFITIGALFLIPVVNGTYAFHHQDLSDISEGFLYSIPSVLAVIFTVVGIAVSKLVGQLRLLVLISASIAGAFTVSGLWERRIFDGLNIVVVIVAWVAVIAVVILMTVWTPDNRLSREPLVQEPPLPTFQPQPLTDDNGPR